MLLHFGLDYLRFNFNLEPTNFELYFHGKSDNSNVGYHILCGQRFQMLWSKSKLGSQVMILHKSSNVMRIEQVTDQGLMRNMKYRVDFYGSFFMYEELQGFMKKFIETFDDEMMLSRVDLCSDWATSPREFLNHGYTTNFQITDTMKENKSTGDFQTMYFGNKSVSQNPRHFFRIYDKKKDIGRKEKMIFYLDYLKHESVTRCEVQINQKSVRAYGISNLDLLDDERLLQIYSSLAYKDKGTKFDGLYSLCTWPDQIIPKRFYEQEVDLSDEISRTRYAQIFLAYGQNLSDQGFDIFAFLEKNIEKSFDTIKKSAQT